MKVDINTVAKCWDFKFDTNKEKSMPIGEFLNYLKNLDSNEPYDQNSDTIDKWLEQGYIDTDDLGDSVTLSRTNKNTIEIWYEYFYDDGCGGDVGSEFSYIQIPQEYDIPMPKDEVKARELTLDTPMSNFQTSAEGIENSCFKIELSKHTLGEWLKKLLDSAKLDEEETKKIKTILDNGGCKTLKNSVHLNTLPIFYTNNIGEIKCIHFVPTAEAEKFNEDAVNRIPIKDEWSYNFGDTDCMPF